MAKITFGWTIEGATPEETKQIEAEIVSAFVEGYQGEFIQEVLGGDVMQLPTVTDQEKKDFAIYKLTQQNLASISEQRLQKVLLAARAVAQANQSKHELPRLPKRGGK